jgi:hypothetical protein
VQNTEVGDSGEKLFDLLRSTSRSGFIRVVAQRDHHWDANPREQSRDGKGGADGCPGGDWTQFH